MTMSGCNWTYRVSTLKSAFPSVSRLSWLCIYAQHPAEYLLHVIRPGRSRERSLVQLDETVLQHDYTVLLGGWLRAEGGRHVRPPHARGLRVAEEFSIDETG